MEEENYNNLGNKETGSTGDELIEFYKDQSRNTCMEAIDDGKIIDELNSNTGYDNIDSSFYDEHI